MNGQRFWSLANNSKETRYSQMEEKSVVFPLWGRFIFITVWAKSPFKSWLVNITSLCLYSCHKDEDRCLRVQMDFFCFAKFWVMRTVKNLMALKTFPLFKHKNFQEKSINAWKIHETVLSATTFNGQWEKENKVSQNCYWTAPKLLQGELRHFHQQNAWGVNVSQNSENIVNYQIRIENNLLRNRLESRNFYLLRELKSNDWYILSFDLPFLMCNFYKMAQNTQKAL